MVDLEWDPNYVPMVKLVLHGLQILISFVVWCLEIAVFMGKGSHITGDNGWTFGVVSSAICIWRREGFVPSFFPRDLLTQNPTVLPLDSGMDIPCHDTAIRANPSLCSTARYACS
jgi:hypothetical protein